MISIKNIKLTVLLTVVLNTFCFTQNPEALPYYDMPKYPEKFTAGTMASRMVDALGFRFYHASDKLTKTDLAYRLNTDGRSTEETINHIFDLSIIIVNSTLNRKNTQSLNEDLSYIEKRARTLKNLKIAADILRDSKDIEQYKIVFGERNFPFWNQVNGPIADAIWHCGQIASYRRASGNPINSKVNQFTGTVNN